jgi:hypothetical protein
MALIAAITPNTRAELDVRWLPDPPQPTRR